MVVAVDARLAGSRGSGQHLRALARAAGRDRDLGLLTPGLGLSLALIKRITDEDVHRRRWQLLALTSVGAFMWPLDGSIVSVALPVMGPDLHLSFTAAVWVSAAFLLTTAVLLIPAGRIADQRGRVRYYLLGIAVFTVASLLCAVSMRRLLADRLAHHPGRRRRAHRGDVGRDRDGGLPAARARPGPGHQRHGRVHRPDRRATPRRLHRRLHRLALDLPHQPPHRHRRAALGLVHAAAQRARAGASPGRARLGAARGVPRLPARAAHLLGRVGLGARRAPSACCSSRRRASSPSWSWSGASSRPSSTSTSCSRTASSPPRTRRRCSTTWRCTASAC